MSIYSIVYFKLSSTSPHLKSILAAPWNIFILESSDIVIQYIQFENDAVGLSACPQLSILYFEDLSFVESRVAKVGNGVISRFNEISRNTNKCRGADAIWISEGRGLTRSSKFKGTSDADVPHRSSLPIRPFPQLIKLILEVHQPRKISSREIKFVTTAVESCKRARQRKLRFHGITYNSNGGQ